MADLTPVIEKPWQPANGAEGAGFQEKFCSNCACDPDDLEKYDGCAILAATMVMNVDDEDYPKQWVDRPGGPICKAFVRRPDDWDGVPLDPMNVERKQAAYDALERDPKTGRPVIR